MKKVLVTILALVYLITSTGAAVNIHYCMGRISSVSLVHNNSKECGKCGMVTTGGCCKDEYKTVKISDSHKQAATYENLIPPVAVINRTGNIYPPKLFEAVTNTTPLNNSPPAASARSLCIINCVFRI